MSGKRIRTELVMFYVTVGEKKEMYKKARNADMSMSDYARKILLGKIPNDYDCEEKNNGR